MRSRFRSSRATRPMPPASWMSTAVKRPPGIRAATIGVRSAMRSKSSRSSGMPSSCAMARRCRTPLVEPPVAATDAMALSIAARVMISRRASPRVDELHHQAPGCLRGIELCRIGCRNPVQAAGTEAQELQGGAHRVRGELAAARAGTGAGRVLDLPQLVEADLPGPIRANRLEYGHDRRVPFPRSTPGWIVPL